jgi:hypothetical protein
LIITEPTHSNITAGVYKIASGGVASGELTLTSAPFTGTSGTATFRICRGMKKWTYDSTSPTLAIWDATSGKGTVPHGHNLIVRYRDRIVVAGGPHAPHNWEMSRQGDANDWDNSETDVGRAMAGNNSDAGTIGEPITALIPHHDDCLIFGATRSLYTMRGDPAWGGQITNLSMTIGVISQGAWCKTPRGNLFFMSPDGVYFMEAGCGRTPTSVSRELMPQELTGIDTTVHTVHMEYDLNHRGIHIFISDIANNLVATHWWMDIKHTMIGDHLEALGSFFKVTNHNDLDVFMTANYRNEALLGGRDGYIRHHDDTAGADETGAGGVSDFDSYVMIGPLRVGRGGGEGVVSEIVGEPSTNGAETDSGDIDWELYVGTSPEVAAASSVRETGQWNTAGFRNYSHPRARGNACFIKIKNGENTPTVRWALEYLKVKMTDGGKIRA